VSADALLYDELPNSKKQMLGSGDTDLLVSLDASRVLYSNLLTGQIDAATANALTTLRQFQRAQQEVRYQTIAAYYEVQRSLKRRDADAQAEKAMQAHAELTQKMFQVGKVPELDVLRVQVQLADLRQRLVVSENAVNLALARLRNVMGISDQEALSVEPPAENLVVELVPVEPEEELLTRAYEQRPEIAAAQAQISRAEAEQRQAAAGKQPEVRAVGSYYREGTSPSLDYKDWYVGVRLSMPLHDSGATQHGVKAAQANQRAAEADLEATRQRVRLDVHEAWLGVREATERIAATQTAVQQATRALEIERKRYELGMNTILDVLDTQTAMTRAQYNFIDAYYAYHTALAKLHLAVADPDGAAPATTVQAGGRLP
jgi:outer membrane protein TolC